MKIENGVTMTLPANRTERAAMVALILSGRERARMELDLEIRQMRELLLRLRGHELAKGDRS